MEKEGALRLITSKHEKTARIVSGFYILISFAYQTNDSVVDQCYGRHVLILYIPLILEHLTHDRHLIACSHPMVLVQRRY